MNSGKEDVNKEQQLLQNIRLEILLSLHCYTHEERTKF